MLVGVYTSGNCGTMSTKAEYTQILRLRNFTPSIYLMEMITCIHQKKHARMVTLALPVIVPNYKLLKCPSKLEIKKLLVYSCNRILYCNGNEWSTNTLMVPMNFLNIMLRGKCQTQKNILHDSFYIRGINRKNESMLWGPTGGGGRYILNEQEPSWYL